MGSIFSCFRNPSLSADHTWTEYYWPLHTPMKREVLHLNSRNSSIMEGLRVKQCAFWRKFLPQLGEKFFVVFDTKVVVRVFSFYHENTFALKLPISWLHHHAFSLTGFNILKNAVGSAKFFKNVQLANTNTRLLNIANFQLKTN